MHLGVAFHDIALNGEKMGTQTKKSDCDVSVDGLTASWYMDHDRLVLSDISFTVDKV